MKNAEFHPDPNRAAQYLRTHVLSTVLGITSLACGSYGVLKEHEIRNFEEPSSYAQGLYRTRENLLAAWGNTTSPKEKTILEGLIYDISSQEGVLEAQALDIQKTYKKIDRNIGLGSGVLAFMFSLTSFDIERAKNKRNGKTQDLNKDENPFFKFKKSY